MINKLYDYKKGYYLGEDEKERIKIILDWAGKGNKILDLGSYDGFIASKIKRQGNDILCMEANKKLISKIKNRGLGVSICDLEKKIPVKSESMDIIIAGEIIEHLVNTDLFISEIYRILKKGGILILTTPNVNSLDRRIMTLFGKNAFFEASFSFPKNSSGHLRFFNKPLLINFLRKNKFKIMDIKTEFIPLSKRINIKFLKDVFPSLGYSLIVGAIK